MTYRGLTEARYTALRRIAVSGHAYSSQKRTIQWLVDNGFIQPSEYKWRDYDLMPAESRKFWDDLIEKERIHFGLPHPECEYGYTRDQVEAIMGVRLDEFNKWMYGQTMTLCEGKAYDHDKKEYEPACGGVAHGPVVYSHDLRGFLAKRPILD